MHGGTSGCRDEETARFIVSWIQCDMLRPKRFIPVVLFDSKTRLVLVGRIVVVGAKNGGELFVCHVQHPDRPVVGGRDEVGAGRRTTTGPLQGTDRATVWFE